MNKPEFPPNEDVRLDVRMPRSEPVNVGDVQMLIGQLRDLVRVLEKTPNNLLQWEIQVDPLTSRYRRRTVTVCMLENPA